MKEIGEKFIFDPFKKKFFFRKLKRQSWNEFHGISLRMWKISHIHRTEIMRRKKKLWGSGGRSQFLGNLRHSTYVRKPPQFLPTNLSRCRRYPWMGEKKRWGLRGKKD